MQGDNAPRPFYIIMPKKFIVYLILIALIVGAAVYFFSQLDDGVQQTEDNTTVSSWVGKPYPCEKYSCADLDVPEKRVKEYFYCLLDCPQAKKYKKFEDGQLASVALVNYDLVGQAQLNDLKICFPKLKSLLGVMPFYDKLISYQVLVSDGADILPDMANEEGAFLRHEKSWFDREEETLAGSGAPAGYFGDTNTAKCSNAHELTHVFTAHLDLPHWMSEGIAEYAVWQIGEPPTHPIECRDNGWFGYDVWEIRKNKLFAYSDMNQAWSSRETGAQMKWYNSAACVFDYIAKTYGQNKIKDVLLGTEFGKQIILEAEERFGIK